MASRDITINVKATTVNVSQSMQQVGNAIQQTTDKVKNMGPPFQAVQKQFNATVSNSKLATTGITNFGNATQQSTGKLQSFGQMFSDNRGIVFGIAGMTSALAEAVGMMGMFSDTQLRLQEAQAELNRLQAEGVTQGKAYTDAQNEVTKQQRFFNMVSRNTVLSQMDMVFFTTMVVSGLVKLTAGTGKATGVLSKLKNVFSGSQSSLTGFDGALNSMNTSFQKSQVGATGLSGALKGLGISIKGLLISTGIGAAVVGIGLLVQAFMEANAAAEQHRNTTKTVTEQASNSIVAFQEINKQSMFEVAGDVKDAADAYEKEMKRMSDAATKAFVEIGKSRNQSFLDEQHSTRISLEAQQATLRAQIQKVKADLDKPLKGMAERYKGVADNIANEKIADLETRLGDVDTQLRAVGGTIIETTNKMSGLGTATEGTTINFEQMSQDIVGPLKSTFADAQVGVEAFWNTWSELVQAGLVDWSMVDEAIAGFGTTMAKNQVPVDVMNKIMEILGQNVDDVNGVIEEQTKSVNKAADSMNIYHGVLQGTTGDQAIISWLMQFNDNIKQSSDVIPQATAALSDVKVKYKDVIAAAEQMGMGAEVVGQLVTEETGSVLKGAVAKALYSDEGKESAKALREETKEEKDHAKKLRESIQALAGKSTMITNSIILNEKLAKAFGDTSQGIIDEADALKFNKIAWASMTKEQKQSLDNANSLRLAESKIIPILDETARGRQAVTDAMIKGNQAASDLINTALEENVSLSVQRTRWFEVLSAMDPAIDTTGMLTSEMQELVEYALLPAEQKLHLFKTAIAEATDASRSFWSSVIGAEDNKAFGKAFKEMDLGAIPRKLRDEVKDLFEGMRDDAEKGKEVQTAFTAIQASMTRLGDNLSKGHIKKIFEQGVTVFERGAGSVNVFGQSIHDNILEPLTDLNKKELYSKLEQLPGTMNLITTAQSDGIIIFDEYKDIIIQYAKEGGTLKDLTDEQREALAKMGIVVDETTGKIDTSKVATSQYAQELAKLDANQAVIQAIADMWGVLGEHMVEINGIISTHWTGTMGIIITDTGTTIDFITDHWATMYESLVSNNNDLGSNWKDVVNLMIRLTADTVGDIAEQFENMYDDAAGIFDDMLGEWSDVCADMVTEAENMVDDINSELDNIEDEEVRINYVKTGAGQSKGGVFSFAEGGLVSAAQGLHTTNGPTRLGPFLYGDNSGGRETVAFLPHDGNKGNKIMRELEAMGFSSGSKAPVIVTQGGDRDIIVPITININGEQYSFTRRYRIRQNQEIASQVS